MEKERFGRLLQIVSVEDLAKVESKRIIIFGLGGVGGSALEALVRAGFKHFTIVDNDVIEITNLNRQLLATTKTIGVPKIKVAKDRMLEINPNCKINVVFAQVHSKNIEDFNLESFDYIVDAIDSFEDKMALIVYAVKNKLPIISAMGAGNRFDPTKVIVTKIEKTEGCPLAKKVRYHLRQEKLKGLMVVTSLELPVTSIGNKLGSSSFVPPAFGLAMASYIFRNVISK